MPSGVNLPNDDVADDNDRFSPLEFTLNGDKLTGKLDNAPFEGTFKAGRIEGTFKPNPKLTLKLEGMLSGDRITGTAVMTGSNPGERQDLSDRCRPRFFGP